MAGKVERAHPGGYASSSGKRPCLAGLAALIRQASLEQAARCSARQHQKAVSAAGTRVQMQA